MENNIFSLLEDKKETEIFLNTKYIGREIIKLSTVDSTNTYAKNSAFDKNEGAIITSEQQISGKGRVGRSWASPLGKGIYMSMILKPNLEPMNVAKLTLVGAAAVYMGLKDLNINSKIKWPNDIVIDGKKVCGILTEMNCDLNKINFIIMGIGINVNLDKKDIPDDLKDKATSLKLVTGEIINRNKLLGLVLNHFEVLYDSFKVNLNLNETIKICKENSALLGKEVQIIQNDMVKTGIAMDICSDGELLVEFETGTEKIYYGEVSVRGLNNYI